MEMWVVGCASSTSSSEAGRIDPKRVRNPTNTFTTLQRHPINSPPPLGEEQDALRIVQLRSRSKSALISTPLYCLFPGERRGHQVSQILTCFETRNSAPASSHHCFEDRQSSGFYTELCIFPTSIELTNMAPLASSALFPNMPS